MPPYQNENFSKVIQETKSLPPNSAVLHDFFSFLAQKMIEFNQNKYLLKLFIDNKIKSGTNEMVQVMKLLEKHPEREGENSEELKKGIAKVLLNEHQNQINQTDNLINNIVYHLNKLTENEVEIIERSV